MRESNAGLDALWNLILLSKAIPRSPLPLVIFNPNMPSTDAHRVRTEVGVVFIFFSLEVALQTQIGTWWHDEPAHCRTWTDGGGCACDSEGVDCSPPPQVPVHLQHPAMGAVIFDLRIGPNGLEARGPPRDATPAELAQLQGVQPNTPVILSPPASSSAPATQADPVVLKHEKQGPHDPKSCPTCLSRAAAMAFGGPGTTPGIS